MVTGYTGGGEEQSSPRKSAFANNVTVTGDISAMPDFDCGIYEVPGFPISAITTTQNYYCQVVPNSHWFTDLNQLLMHIDSILRSGNQYYENAFKAEIDYMIIGLKNSIEHGYKIKIVGNSTLDFAERPYQVFWTIESILAFIKNVNISGDYNGNEFLKDLNIVIENTIQCGYNLTNGLKMERKEVYNRIDGERDYQDQTWVARRTANGTPDEEKPVAEWINYMEFHLAKAKNEVYYLKTEAALAELRKVAALAVRAMEIHGCPERPVGIGEPKSPPIEFFINNDGSPAMGTTAPESTLNLTTTGDVTMGCKNPESKLEIKNSGCGGNCGCKK